MPGYHAGTGGIAGGFDTTFALGSGTGRLGFGLGYTSTGISVAASSANVDAWYAGVYGGLENGPFSASGSVNYSWQGYDFSRYVAFIGGGGTTATATANGRQFAASGEASYDLARRLGLRQDIGLRLAPTISIDHVSGWRGGFTETGAGVLDLTVAPDMISQTWLGAGVSMSARMTGAGGVVFMPSLRVMYQHNAGQRRLTTASAIPAASASFTTPGVFEDADLVAVGAGLGIELNKRASLDFRYDGTFGAHTTSHAGKIGLTVKF